MRHTDFTAELEEIRLEFGKYSSSAFSLIFLAGSGRCTEDSANARDNIRLSLEFARHMTAVNLPNSAELPEVPNRVVIMIKSVHRITLSSMQLLLFSMLSI